MTPRTANMFVAAAMAVLLSGCLGVGNPIHLLSPPLKTEQISGMTYLEQVNGPVGRFAYYAPDGTVHIWIWRSDFLEKGRWSVIDGDVCVDAKFHNPIETHRTGAWSCVNSGKFRDAVATGFPDDTFGLAERTMSPCRLGGRIWFPTLLARRSGMNQADSAPIPCTEDKKEYEKRWQGMTAAERATDRIDSREYNNSFLNRKLYGSNIPPDRSS